MHLHIYPLCTFYSLACGHNATVIKLTEEDGWAIFTRKNNDENVEMDDGNSEDWKIRTEEIRASAGVANMSQKSREAIQSYWDGYELQLER